MTAPQNGAASGPMRSVAAVPAVLAPVVAAAPAADRVPRGLAPAWHQPSEELQEMIAYVPNALVRWGASVVCAVLVTLLLLAWFVQYPIVVTGELAVTTPTPPVRLVARGGGEVRRLLVRDGEQVAAGADLALLSSPVDYDGVRTLGDRLAAFERAMAGSGHVPNVVFPQELALGEIQSAYLPFLQRLADQRSLGAGLLYDAKLASLREEIRHHERLELALREQRATAAEQLDIAGRERTRARALATRGLLAPAEVERVEADYLQKRFGVEGSTGALATNDIQLAARRGAVADLERQRAEDVRTRLLALRAATTTLREAIRQWEQQYLLRSPVAGRVSFFRVLAPGQFVAASEPVLAVVPRTGGLVARVRLADAGAGRVRVGQRVVLRFASYPPNEYGTVTGRVERISLLANEGQGGRDGGRGTAYLVEVSLPIGLRTSHGRVLDFRQEMRGSADIVTDELRVLQRVFNQFRRLTARAGEG
jgi:multidrug resistance efflux pump